MIVIDESLELSGPEQYGFVVRSIVEDDIELLRIWKNAFRGSFFFKAIITEDMQKEWFQGYIKRAHDFMWVVVNNDKRIGCLGFRFLGDRIDLYNIILGHQQSAGRGYMARALDLICHEAIRRYPAAPIMASVLRKNPALNWYFKRGFVVTKEHDDYLELTRKQFI